MHLEASTLSLSGADFPKIRGTLFWGPYNNYFGVLIIRILLFRVLY